MADAQRFLRYLRMAVVCILAALAFAVEILAHSFPAPLQTSVLYVFYAVAAADAVIAVMLRRRFSAPAAEILRQNPEDSSALLDWIKGQLLPLPMALSLGFLGVMARYLGAAPLSTAPFYLLALLLLFVPGEPDPTF